MKYQSYNNFWQRLHNSAKDKGFPLRVMFELTYQCNFHCQHCYVPNSYRKRGELNTKEVFLVLNELKNIGCFYLGFTGGEPFVREDIMQILWYAKKKGFEIIIYTNGSLIDEALADELATLRPNKVDITIPGMSHTSFERISGVSGSREKVFTAINLLRENKVALGFKTCVLKENESEIKGIQDFARSLGALHRLDDMLSPRLDGSKEPFKYRGILKRVTGNKSPFDCISNRNNVSLRAPKGRSNHAFEIAQPVPSLSVRDCFTPPSAGFAMTGEESPRNDGNLFKCGTGVSQAAITPLGELKPCLMIDYPKYKISGAEDRKMRMDANQTRMGANKYSRELALDSRGFALKDAWERLKELVASIKPDKDYKCNRCELEPYCKWCPARGWLYNKTFTSCEPESRKKAEVTMQSLIQ